MNTGPGARAPIAAVVLAAGRAARMQGTNKLLEEVSGQPMVRRVVETALAAGAEPVVVVTGHAHAEVEAALAGAPVQVVRNERWAEGLATSLAVGVATVEGRVSGALICLGDMPRVTESDLRALTRAFEAARADPEAPPPAACAPVHEGQVGNPVLWSAEWFQALQKLAGDRGARALLDRLGERVIQVPAGPGVLMDADTPEALARLRAEPPADANPTTKAEEP